MVDAIGDILSGKDLSAPPEVKIIKDFVLAKFQTLPTVTVQERQLIIGVPSSALAGALRMHLHELSQLCQTDKRLVIRIGLP